MKRLLWAAMALLAQASKQFVRSRSIIDGAVRKGGAAGYSLLQAVLPALPRNSGTHLVATARTRHWNSFSGRTLDGQGTRSMDDSRTISRGSRHWNWLLAIPFFALLWVPFYNFSAPLLWGIPFFYWYQFLWVILTSIIIIFVHHRTG